MKLIPNFNSPLTLRIIFAISIFILLFITSVSYKHNRDLQNSSKLMMHTYEINIQLERLLSFVKDAETGQRGYIITKNSRFLAPYLFSRDKVNRSFIKLKKLITDNPKQQQNLKNLFDLIIQRYTYLEGSLKYSNEKTYDKRKLDNCMFGGRIVMENIRFQIDEMNDVEKEILQKRQKIYQSEISLTPFFSISLFLVALSFILLSYRQISNDIDRLKIFNKKLLISSRLMAESEIIGAFSTWQWDLGTDKIVYSDNQYRLLGYPPNSFVPEKESFLEFVHPEDKRAIANSMQAIINHKQLPLIYYKAIRKNGDIRHFKSIGKLLIDEQGNKIILGITFDITEEHFQNIAIYERNKELEKSNKELASFNHVASHDLQEPLRKIQTFISRISDNDMNSLSESGKNYIIKIDASAKRMRILIDDLLLFSRTNTTKKEFIKTNLNDLFEKVKLELSEIIQEGNAVITSDKLPKLKVIPYQIEQLFINLISNSLKYSQPNVSPEINISCEKITSKEFPDLLEQSIKKYYKITFADNGMGFDPQFKETIFVLFQRLHSKTDEYPGTGIGLAICKKIVENHKGHIVADSTPDKGSIFTIFLPE
ncbi:CHASE3 domain-containing protein [Flavobacterium sp. F-65]|uniref:histidine kinase n=1 Tax=Flavobacterium pisciphilum TaxID=2893755 RepID=A0ABS8N0T6_9FLAO|nr:CHASE3 domain-containing protein [Flavobacterium sp. F-65]MCC9073710.1 CHASE3 domain-containing protein [Flavobacterium sp. F-65]